MMTNPSTQAILLLTVRFTKSGSEAVKPLSPTEWGRFAEWLKAQELTPEALLQGQLPEVLQTWQDPSISIERLQALLDRGSALALSMEKWTRSGLWVLTRADKHYPNRLKQRLGMASPAVLFGCGNQNLLKGGGLAVVGSRNACEEDIAYSRELGALAARKGHSIVSGGARGIDQAAMLGALEAEGTAVGVLANGLLRASSGAKYRRFLMQKDLALISPFNPEAGFHVGNAMQRNKYIYCLADAAVVVHSGLKGGTWTGARENLKNHWAPLGIKPTNDPQAGNDALVREGAKWISDTVEALDFESLFAPVQPQPEQRSDLFTWGASMNPTLRREHHSTTYF